MKRKLLKQIGNEWRSNVWLGVELLIVSVVMWFITDNLYTAISTLNEPRGFNTDHCYLIKYALLNQQSPEFIPDKSNSDNNADFLTIMDRLEKRPEIECVAAGQNSYFYNGSNSNTYMATDTFSSSGYLLRRLVSPDFPRVFRIRGANGETPEQLSELLKEPRAFLISDNAFKEKYNLDHMGAFIGKEFSNHAYGDTLVLKAAYETARYNDFQAAEWSTSMMSLCPEGHYIDALNELVVRVRDNMDTDFIENLMNDADSHFRIGNLYIASVQSFDDIRQIHQRANVTGMRTFFAGAAFLALNIFLGLLGTFWFRTRMRISEIAIRKANGATRSDIFRRVISEGEILLLVITPLAILFDWLIVHFEFNTYYHGAYFEPSRFIACVVIAWAFMALMILLGILIPANRAMKIAPAKALMGE